MAKGKKTGGGSRKGCLNKENKQLREMILGAFNAWESEDGKKKGGVEWLTKQMDANPASFMTLLGRVLPTTLQGPTEDGSFNLKVTFVDADNRRTDTEEA